MPLIALPYAMFERLEIGVLAGLVTCFIIIFGEARLFSPLRPAARRETRAPSTPCLCTEDRVPSLRHFSGTTVPSTEYDVHTVASVALRRLRARRGGSSRGLSGLHALGVKALHAVLLEQRLEVAEAAQLFARRRALQVERRA